MTKMKTGSKVMNWRKEFDNRFSWEINGFDGPREEIIDFIDQAIQSERQRIIKQIKSFMKKKCIVTTKDLIADITNEIKNENKNQIL
jgi:hypothetical protein